MYLVICTDNKGNEILVERSVSDAESWDETVASLAGGEWRDVTRVIRACDGQDVLPLMRKWIDYKMPNDDPEDFDVTAFRNDHRHDLRKHETA